MEASKNIELVLVFILASMPFLIIFHRIWTNKGLGARSIQFLAVGMLVPAVLILSLEAVIDSATVGTLIGAMVGYLLSGIGEFNKNKNGTESEPKTKPEPRLKLELERKPKPKPKGH